LYAKIRDHIIDVKAASEIQPLIVKCTDCSQDYQQTVTLDMTSFFADAS
jgi:hypothetical protein